MQLDVVGTENGEEKGVKGKRQTSMDMVHKSYSFIACLKGIISLKIKYDSKT